MNKLFAIIINLMISQYIFAQQAGIPKNQSFTISASNLQTGDLYNNEQYTYIFKSLGKIENDRLFECRIVRAAIKDTEGQPDNINTDSLDKIQFYNSNPLSTLALLNRAFQIRLNTKNKIVEVTGVRDILKNAAERWALQPEIGKFLQTHSEQSLITRLQFLFLQLPEKKLAFGSSWTNEENHMQYRVAGIKGALLIINTTYADPQYGSLQGKIVYNEISGLSESVEFSGRPTASSTQENGETKALNVAWKYTQQFDRQTKAYTTDTAWIDMAIQLSHWSDYLKTGTETDSTKVAHFLTKNETKFANDTYYRKRILSAVQSIRGENSYRKYDELLGKTPNEFLKGESSHLHNKMHIALTESGEAAYAIVPYIYQFPSFNDWIHMSFAQAFLTRDDEDYRKREVKAYRLAELIHQDKNRVIQQKTHALYLWVTAKKQSREAPLLIKTAEEFKKMDDVFMRQGNGGRYALLMYKLLEDLQKYKEASSLLDNTIEKLTRYTLDTLNKERYEHQYLLAHAYFLKAETVKMTDNTKYMQYLSQAARYSVKDQKEAAYASFYDRVFLNSKESYLDDFMNQLLKMGNTDEALKIFVNQINIAPDNLAEMEKVYRNKFPDKSFADFFRKEVINTWKDAPDFKLLDLDGQEFNLSKYQNKWLIIDFWGTWCAPCREEMPQLNKFNSELEAGKYPDVQFLSIACYDQTERVREYFTANQFTIPVAMSDGLVQKNYEVNGYPSKVLISPDGKMISIAFGKNWNGILDKFLEVYASK